VWQRAFIAAAGPLASFVLAIVIFSGMAMAAGSVQLLAPRIAHVEPLSPAARAGLVPGDLILRVDDRPVRSWEDFQQFVRMHGGDSVAIDVRRQGQERTAIALLERRAIRMPVVGTTARLGYLGVGPSLTKADIITIQFTPITAVQEGFRQTGEIISSTVGYISRIFRGAENGDQFSGPLGIAHTAGAVANAAGQGAPDAATGLGRSLLALVGLAGFISAGVGFLNLLPLPVLDGGHLLFYAYEALARRPVAAHIQAIGYRVGFVLLIGLMLFASRNDLQQLGVLKFLGGLFS
jgi:regulator of sigma E protease